LHATRRSTADGSKYVSLAHTGAASVDKSAHDRGCSHFSQHASTQSAAPWHAVDADAVARRRIPSKQPDDEQPSGRCHNSSHVDNSLQHTDEQLRKGSHTAAALATAFAPEHAPPDFQNVVQLTTDGARTQHLAAQSASSPHGTSLPTDGFRIRPLALAHSKAAH